MGAYLHAQKAVAEHVRIDGVLNNDIVGNDRGGNGIVDGASIRSLFGGTRGLAVTRARSIPCSGGAVDMCRHTVCG